MKITSSLCENNDNHNNTDDELGCWGLFDEDEGASEFR